MKSDLFGLESGAFFSPDRRYRYHLWRRWDKTLPSLAFLMLNPSVAAEDEDDPTITRCITRARKTGYGALEVVNLFALVSTDPRRLYAPGEDPIGPENDRIITDVVLSCGTLVCAWSAHARHLGRETAVLDLLQRLSVTPHVLTINKDGTPRHPLYISYDITPRPWVLTS